MASNSMCVLIPNQSSSKWILSLIIFLFFFWLNDLYISGAQISNKKLHVLVFFYWPKTIQNAVYNRLSRLWKENNLSSETLFLYGKCRFPIQLIYMKKIVKKCWWRMRKVKNLIDNEILTQVFLFKKIKCYIRRNSLNEN